VEARLDTAEYVGGISETSRNYGGFAALEKYVGQFKTIGLV